MSTSRYLPLANNSVPVPASELSSPAYLPKVPRYVTQSLDLGFYRRFFAQPYRTPKGNEMRLCIQGRLRLRLRLAIISHLYLKPAEQRRIFPCQHHQLPT